MPGAEGRSGVGALTVERATVDSAAATAASMGLSGAGAVPPPEPITTNGG